MDLGRSCVDNLGQTLHCMNGHILLASIPDNWSGPVSIPTHVFQMWSWISVDLLMYSLCVYLNKSVSVAIRSLVLLGSVGELVAHEDYCYLPKSPLSCLCLSFPFPSLPLSSEFVEYILEKVGRKQIVQNQICLGKEKAK